MPTIGWLYLGSEPSAHDDESMGAPEFMSILDIAKSLGVSKSVAHRYYKKRGIKSSLRGGRPRKT